MRVTPALLCALAIGCALSGCGPIPTGTLALSWQFADGRFCTDAGASTIEARLGETTLGSFACEAGLAPAQVMLGKVPEDDATIDLFALSPRGVALYRGQLRLSGDPNLAPATVTLYADLAR